MEKRETAHRNYLLFAFLWENPYLDKTSDSNKKMIDRLYGNGFKVVKATYSRLFIGY